MGALNRSGGAPTGPLREGRIRSGGGAAGQGSSERMALAAAAGSGAERIGRPTTM